MPYAFCKTNWQALQGVMYSLCGMVVLWFGHQTRYQEVERLTARQSECVKCPAVSSHKPVANTLSAFLPHL